MLVHIVYCHPSEDSLTAQVRDAFIRGLDAAGVSHTISDLYKQGFSTDMTEREYLRDAYYNLMPPLADDVIREQALINAADSLVFIYPLFWTEAPAKLVGWFDRVWSYGFAYGQDELLELTTRLSPGQAEKLGLNVVPMKRLDRALFIVIAGNTAETLEEQGRLTAMRTVMLEDRIYDRAAVKELVLLGGTERNTPEQRERMAVLHLQSAYDLGTSFKYG
ncbi:MAG: NAD(P)H-dependent oxidoreductase [Coriobacteriia bacterium]|nr:NAD(P)H-dependent oxidoreductase [Coriobacteriia bacterium]